MAISRSWLLCVVLAVAGCSQPPLVSADKLATPAPPPPQAPPPAESPAQAISLAGDWRVAGIDGRSFDEPYGLSLKGDDRQLWWEPRCAGFARTYSIQGASITFGPTQPPTPPGSPTPPVCAIGIPPRLGEVFQALDSAVSVARTPNNGILISGPAHSVTLFPQ